MVRIQAEAVKDAKMKNMIRDNKIERDYLKPGKYKLARTQETSGRWKKEMISGTYPSNIFTCRVDEIYNQNSESLNSKHP